MGQPDDVAATAASLLHRPGLVVLTGPPGCGRSTLLRAVADAFGGPVHAGGGLAMLAGVPALALSRAVRARLPGHDVHLLAEAVRSRVRGGLLVLDDLQYADPATPPTTQPPGGPRRRTSVARVRAGRDLTPPEP